MIIYKGLFFLLLGVSIYTFLLLILRLISMSKKREEIPTAEPTSWYTKEKLTIVDIISETHDVKTFRLKRENGKDFSTFSPGQFLSFQIKDDTKLLRSYSISGSCENKSTLQVSIKKLPRGIGSTWFHSLAIGEHVWAFPPGGLFSDDKLKAQYPRVYIGGGIGITPLLSMIKTAIDRASQAPMTLFYGMNSMSDLAFHQELTLLDQQYKNFFYFPLLSKEDSSWSGDTGFINYDYIKARTKIDSNTHFYFCGPPIMTESISRSILAANHNKKFIHSEKFLSPNELDPKNLSEVSARVSINGDVFPYQGSSSILEFLEENNIDINFACRSGVCGACKCKLLEGDVESFTDSGLSESEKEDGFILSCVSRPRADIKILLPKE